jgi:hypothetical protein
VASWDVFGARDVFAAEAPTRRSVSRLTGAWRAQRPLTKASVVLAALFALASLVNLAASGLGRATTAPVAATLAPGAASAGPVPTLSRVTSPATAGKTWVVGKVWRGSGSRETEAFTVGERWRVDWLFNPAQAGASLQVFIYHSDGRLLMDLAANSQRGGADSSFWAGPGTYFLRVSSNGGDWKVAVQDLR